MKIHSAFWRNTAAAAVVLSVTFSTGIAYAGHQFNDVPDSSIFHDEIDFMVDRAITLGCGGGNYCPSDDVTREQMAAFLERTARALSPVVLVSRDAGLVEDDPECIIGPYIPDFEQVASFNGGVYAHGPGVVSSRVQYSADGGSWTDVSGTWYLPGEPAANDFGVSPVVGYQQLDPGTSYRFSVDSANLGDGSSTGCQLTAIIAHQMPDAAPGPVPFTATEVQNFDE